MQGGFILQKKSQYQLEAGIFYVKLPQASSGFIFSITDKKFPFVLGDGKTRLGDLILKDRRAQIIASTYFERHQDLLEYIVPNEEPFLLSECGNHCQGAIFLNGIHLSTPELLAAIEKIAIRIPDFYFGRFDVRYMDEESLRKGKKFEIIEVNGAGSEATHIWDSRTTLIQAYLILLQQWNYLFQIGASIKRTGLSKRPSLMQFILNCAKVYFRKGPMTTSS